MQPDAFTSQERGTVRRDTTGFWAFCPKPLPQDYRTPQALASLLDEATGAVHRLGTSVRNRSL